MPGSVAFLSSGKIVHAILPKSQCWCVDGETVFVLRIRSNDYYRIELPNEGTEDRLVANEFKAALVRVAQYEATACPFKRGFYVELPETPQTPKRPWRPKHSPISPTPAVTIRKSREAEGPQDSTPPNEVTADLIGGNGDTEAAEDTVERTFKNDGKEGESAGTVVRQAEQESVVRLVAAFEDIKGDEGEGEQVQESLQHLEEPHPSDSISGEDSLSEASEAETPDPQASPVVALSGSTNQIYPRAAIKGHGIDVMQESTTRAQEIIQDLSQHKADVDKDPVEDSDFVSEAPSSTMPATSGRDGVLQKVDISGFRWLDDPEELETPTTSRPVTQVRSVTAPSRLNRDPSSIKHPSNDEADAETGSIASSIESIESFQSFHSPSSPLGPSPPCSQNPSPAPYDSPVDIPRTRPHRRDVSELTIKADHDCSPVDMSTPTWPGDSPTNPLPSNTTAPAGRRASPSPQTRPTTPDRPTRSASPSASIRRRLNRRRAPSPLPSPANLYIPQARLSGGHVTSVILQKTCSLLLGPPVQLVALMLNIAARLAAGSLTATTFTYNERGQPIPCSWGEEDSEGGNGSDDEDDYGISIGGTPEARRRRVSPSKEAGNWEID